VPVALPRVRVPEVAQAEKTISMTGSARNREESERELGTDKTPRLHDTASAGADTGRTLSHCHACSAHCSATTTA
jgi:hypothetical protein